MMNNSPLPLRRTVALVIMLISVSTAAYTEYLSITPAGQKNIGSGAAYSAVCEMEGFIPVGGARRILKAAGESLSPDDALIVRRQFQTSLQEKKIYSPSRDEWFDFVIDEKNCADVAKAAPLVLDMFTPR